MIRIIKESSKVKGVKDAHKFSKVLDPNLDIDKLKSLRVEDPKITALGRFLSLDVDEMNEIEEIGDNNYTYNDQEYLVLTDEEADNYAKYSIISLIDDIGISNLNNINVEEFVDEDWFDDAMRESDENYVNDIENEYSKNFENRLIEEMYDNDILIDDDFERDEDGNIDFKNLKSTIDIESLKEQYVDKRSNDYNNSIEWYIENFGESEFYNAIREYNLLNIDKLAEYLVEQDGRGSILAGYDSNENYEEVDGIEYYIYRTN